MLYKAFYAGNPLLLWPVLSLLLFMGVFLLASLRAARAHAPGRQSRLPQLPLESEESLHPEDRHG
jgi:hypothetical protein